MEGLGPSAGKAKPLDVVIAGVDAFAADSVACAVMGIRAQDIAHLRMGSQRGYGVIDLASIKVHPENWKDVQDTFAPPPKELSLEFSGFSILDKQSCSACQSTLLMFLKEYGQQLYDSKSDDGDITIAIGKGHEKLPIGAVCVGNCTAKHKNSRKFVSGCPPVSSEIMSMISKDNRPSHQN
jgi:hypothetical protein